MPATVPVMSIYWLPHCQMSKHLSLPHLTSSLYHKISLLLYHIPNVCLTPISYYYHSLKSEAKQILYMHALHYLNYRNALLYHEHYGCNALQCYGCSQRLAPTMFLVIIVLPRLCVGKIRQFGCHSFCLSVTVALVFERA